MARLHRQQSSASTPQVERFRRLSEFYGRVLLSPGGQHQYAWFTGQADSTAQHQDQRLEVEPWRRLPPDPVLSQQPQNGLQGLRQQHFVQLVSEVVQPELAKQQQQQQSPLDDSQQQPQAHQGQGQQRLMLVSDQHLKQVVGGALRSQMMQLHAQQQQEQQEQQPIDTLSRLLSEASSGPSNAAVDNDPMAFLQPTIQQLPVTAAALRGENSRYGTSTNSGNRSNRQIYALADLIAVKAARIVAQHLQQPLAPGASAAQVIAPRPGQVEAGSAAGARAAATTGAAVAGSTTTMSHWDTFAQFDSWADQNSPGHSKSRRALEEENDNTWWKAAGTCKQRISDFRKLLGEIDKKTAELTAAEPRFRSRVCKTAEAAAVLDEQCRAEGVNFCGYFSKHLKAKGASKQVEAGNQRQVAAAATSPTRPSRKRRKQVALDVGQTVATMQLTCIAASGCSSR